jgi:predicted site-specific integrase-resolvase
MDSKKLEELKDEILSRKELMEIFGVTTQTVWKWVRAGYIREHAFGRDKIYLKSEILEDVRNNGSTLRKNHRIEA